MGDGAAGLSVLATAVWIVLAAISGVAGTGVAASVGRGAASPLPVKAGLGATVGFGPSVVVVG